MFNKKGLVFQKTDGGVLKISTGVLCELQRFVQVGKKDHESGGVIMGRYLKESKNIIIDKITTPQPNDQSSPIRFYKNKKEHQKIIEDVWVDSEGTCNFLGEWHTHPEDNPSPSHIDIKNWVKIVTKATFESESLFFLIVGRKEICAYEVNKKDKGITPLKWQKKQ